MKDRGAVLLVACYELGHQPLAVAWPAAFLEREGYAPAVMDVSVEPFDPERVRRAKLVAISVPMHTALRLGVTVARRVREVNPTCHIAFYGLYATLNAGHLLGGLADSVMSGEIERALVELVQTLEGGQLAGGSPEPAPAGSRPVLAKLDFPAPSRAALPSLKKYAHLERDGQLELVGYVEASRGCKHLCRHCPIPPVYGGRFFVVPVDVLLADVRQQVEAGATHITFGDPDFLNGPGHAMAFARALHAAFPSLTFDFTAKIEHLLRHRHRLPELARLGCAFIVSAAESLSDAVLAHLNKGHTRADIETALSLTAQAGITLRPTWVPFTPWTTLEDYRELLEFVESNVLVDAIDPVQLSIRLLVPPRSLLLESAALRPFLGELVDGQFYHRWTHPDPRMETLHAAVSSLIAEAADRREDAAVTFQRIRELADQRAGAAPRPVKAPAARRKRSPRLTEPWFC
ncbi:MAG TPA: CUAEP/CCAEP-tail radical SAM protein [Methylomirabilota bacterium]|nr:CUAEP/CCAEP-tail radical SAM protein [Methylomirabilota bacterium]